MFGTAIGQLGDDRKGIHLLWQGPHDWVYSPGGWSVRRRPFVRRKLRSECATMSAGELAMLRLEREVITSLGPVRLTAGRFPVGLASLAGVQPISPEAEILRAELDQAAAQVTIQVVAERWFAIALRRGKVTRSADPRTGAGSMTLEAAQIDEVAVYALGLEHARICTDTAEPHPVDWDQADVVVEGLQLPLRELMPELATADAEADLALSRLLPGESLDRAELRDLLDTLRAGFASPGMGRPIERSLLLDAGDDAQPIELTAVDALQSVIVHPTWRRALGFGWFDRASLEVGRAYEYLIRGKWPAQRSTTRGFHTIPSGTSIPADFFLGDARLRLPQPSVVELASAVPEGAARRVRRGVALGPRTESWWKLPDLGEASLLIDLPQPITEIELALTPGHELRVRSFAAGGVPLDQPVPPDGEIQLTQPSAHLELHGTGFLAAIRTPIVLDAELTEQRIELPPVVYEDTQRPAAPAELETTNRQAPVPAPEVLSMPEVAPARRSLGFRLRWIPALADGVLVWPSDAEEAPPIDAAFFELERRRVRPPALVPGGVFEMLAAAPPNARAADVVTPALLDELRHCSRSTRQHARRDTELGELLERGDVGDVLAFLGAVDHWTPVLPDTAWITGDRAQAPYDPEIRPGTDLMRAFPEHAVRPGGPKLFLTWDDVLDLASFGAAEAEVLAPGTYHQYRIRAVDAAGRAGTSWTEGAITRLEKHLPPPPPVGPLDRELDASAGPVPVGVQARALVRGAPDLTAADRTLLGEHHDAIVIRWGWHAQQRALDPWAKEVRVYLSRQQLDEVAGTIVSITELAPGRYAVALQLGRDVTANAASGLYLRAPHPFRIVEHSAGRTITAVLEMLIPNESGDLARPAIGPALFPLPLAPARTRASSWDERVWVEPITDAASYEHILYDRLMLDADHPRDQVWIGVTAADDQRYVADTHPSAEPRHGNESPVAFVQVTARYHSRPDLPAQAPALDPVPAVWLPDRRSGELSAPLDLTSYFAPALAAGERVRLERADEAAIATRFETDGTRIFARHPDTGQRLSEIEGANPLDADAITRSIGGGIGSASLDDRYLIFLAAAHPMADALFELAGPAAAPLAPTEHHLPRSGRYVYRARRANADGLASLEAVTARVVVHVPSTAQGASPYRAPRLPSDPDTRLRIALPADDLAREVAIFTHTNPPNGAVGAGSLLLAATTQPGAGLRVRAADGAVITPTIHAVTDGQLVDAERVFVVDAPPGFEARVSVWACSITADGAVSPLAGPWAIALPPTPVPLPTATAIALTPSGALITWTWPTGAPALRASIEAADTPGAWRRISPLVLAERIELRGGAPTRAYRLRVHHPDGRTAVTDPLVP